ncbi:DUF3592 domain-containing protein [Alteromonas sp. S005]|uniref:DUF3592 domain-containing protein n=1 Tax=Alteromonas sp. S005 TaxID=3117400 RepID=UPI002FE2C8B4
MTIEVSRAQLRKARWGVYFVASIALVFVIVFSIQVFQRLAGPVSSMNWVPIKATIINVYIDEMITTTTRDNRSQYTLYTPRILYKYNTSGQEHTGKKVTWYDIYDDGFMLELGGKLKRKFSASEPIEIYINPNNTAESVMIKDIIWEHMSTLLVGFIISWSGFLWLVYVLIFKLKYKR